VVKKVLSVLVAFTLVFSLSAIESAGLEVTIPYAEFSSLEDFLNAYLTAKEGECIGEFVDFGFGWSPELTKMTELETFYLLTIVPENFVIRFIQVNEYFVWVKYLHKDATPPEWARNARNVHWDNPYYNFTFRRDSDNERLRLRTYNMVQSIDREALPSEVRAIDLTDTVAVRMLINHLTQPFTTADALTVLRAAAGLLELTAEQAERFGIDSAPATADALRILRIVAGL
jgi:hypothetical protein